MPGKQSTASKDKVRGSCSIDAITEYLKNGTFPKDYTKNDKRALHRRVKSFILIGGELYFTAGRSRHNKGPHDGGGDGDGGDRDESVDPVLRKVVSSKEEQQEIMNKAHVGKDGCHYGMERTIEQVSNQYYWLGITYGVRDVITNCPKCSWRMNRAESSGTSEPKTAVKRPSSRKSELGNSKDEERADESGNETEGYDATEDDDNVLSKSGSEELQPVKQEIAVGLIKDFMRTKGAGNQKPTKGKKRKSSDKSSTSNEREWNRRSCTSLEAVKQYLLNDTIPEDIDRNEKKVFMRRVKSFVLQNDELYFTGGRKNQKGTADPEAETEIDNTQSLRKVVFSDEEKQAVIKQAHIGSTGFHQGMERTSEEVASHYYWVGITYDVREAILACPQCSSRSKNARRSHTLIPQTAAIQKEDVHVQKKAMATGAKVARVSRIIKLTWNNQSDSYSVTQELLPTKPPVQIVQSHTVPPEVNVAPDKGTKKSVTIQKNETGPFSSRQNVTTDIGARKSAITKEKEIGSCSSRENVTTDKGAKTSATTEEEKKGPCTSMEIVKRYLRTGRLPKGYSRNAKRALFRRVKSFVLIKNELYFTGGRSRHNKALIDTELAGADNPENEPDHTQVLRKVVFSEEEQQEILNKAHISDDGTHNGVERTTERVSNEHYWLGITYGVRNTIINCPTCSSRARTVSASRALPLSRRSESTSSSFNTIQATALPTSATKSSGTECDTEMEYDHEEEVGGDYGFEEETTHGGASFTDSQSIKQEWSAWPTDVFSATNEVSNYFWQKVEIQIFGPYQAGKKQVYVTVALDSYSQFPEAVTMEVLSSATLTNFFLNLFCRYGVMEKVLLLQNQVTKNKELHFNMPDLLQAGIAPYMFYPAVSSLDERWNHIEKSLSRFVGLYPKFWFHCLEAFMVPLRITLPPEAVYSPYYLVHGREPPVPDKLSQVCGMNASLNMEVQLTEDEAKQTTDLITSAYGINSDHPSIPATLPVPISVKEPTQPCNESLLQKSKESRSRLEPEPTRYKEELRRSARTENAGCKKMRMMEDEAREKQTTIDVETAFDADSGGGGEFDDDNDNDASYTPDVKTVPKIFIKKTPSMPGPKRGRPRSIIRSRISESPHFTRIKLEMKRMMSGVHSETINNIKQLPLETLYFVLKRYLEQNTFPRGMSKKRKDIVTQLSAMFCVKDGKLYSSAGKSAGRLVITKEKSRFCLLRKAHARGETHHNRTSVLKYLSDLNVFWNGMSLDVDAFIHSCPECIIANPLGNLSVVHIPSQSDSLSAEGRMEDEPHFSEDEEEESSYEDLIQYLTDNTFPPTTTPEQQSRIQQRSQSFCIINGSLYYQTELTAAPRQVLFSETSKHSAIKEAHIENGHHLSQQDTQARLRVQYFWSGMTFDVLKSVMSCCMRQALSTPPVLHRNSVIQERVDKIRSYYSTKRFPKLNPSVIVYEEAGPAQDNPTENVEGSADSLNSKGNNPSTAKETAGGFAEECILKTVEKIIKCVSKPVIGNKKTDTGEKGGSTGDAPSSSTRNQKLPHKCQYCGKIVGGSVAFKIHVYKHTGVKPFTCATCGKSFTTNRSLLIHTRKHTGVKPYLCNQCGRGFFRSASLHYHLKAHAIGKGTPVSCDVCGRSFSTQHRLNRHKEFKHPVHAKVYMCNQCGKHFTAARSLKRHEQIHTGHRKYQCQFCSKSFFRKEYLNAHLPNHPEYDSELEKQKPRERPNKKSQPRTESLPRAMHWLETKQATSHIAETITNLDTYQPVSAQHSLPSSQVTSSHITHGSNIAHTSSHMAHTSSHISQIPSTSAIAHSQMVHHSLHPIMHTARLMNVAGSHGPLSLAMSSGRPQVEMVHAGNGQEILLQHDTLPVQYGVDCLSGEAQGHLSEADINAIHMLAHQSGISGASLHNM